MYGADIVVMVSVILIIPYRVLAGKLERIIASYPYFSGQRVWGKVVAFGDLREIKGFTLLGTECFAVVEWEEAGMKQSACILRHEEDLVGSNILLSVDKKKGLAVRCKTGKYFIKWGQTDLLRGIALVFAIGACIFQLSSEPIGFVLIGVIFAVYLAWLPYIYAYIQSVWKNRYRYGEPQFEGRIHSDEKLSGMELFISVLFEIAVFVYIFSQ